MELPSGGGAGSRRHLRCCYGSVWSVGCGQFVVQRCTLGPLKHQSLVVLEVLKLMKKPATPARKRRVNPFTKEPCVFKSKPASKMVRVFAIKKLKDASVLVELTSVFYEPGWSSHQFFLRRVAPRGVNSFIKEYASSKQVKRCCVLCAGLGFVLVEQTSMSCDPSWVACCSLIGD